MHTKQSIYVIATAALLLGAASVPAVAVSLNLNAGTSGGVTANVGLGNGAGGATANVNVGGQGNYSGTDASVNASLGELAGPNTTTADVELDPGNGINGTADVRLGRGSSASPGANSVEADLSLLSGGGNSDAGTAQNDVADADLKVGVDLQGLASGSGSGAAGGTGTLGGESGSTVGDGSLGGGSTGSRGTFISSAGGGGATLNTASCISPAGKQLLDTAAHTRYGTVGAATWAHTSTVKVVPVKFCPQLRQAVSNAIHKNADLIAMQASASSDPVIRASLHRGGVGPENILLARKSGQELTLYVF